MVARGAALAWLHDLIVEEGLSAQVTALKFNFPRTAAAFAIEAAEATDTDDTIIAIGIFDLTAKVARLAHNTVSLYRACHAVGNDLRTFLAHKLHLGRN